MAEEDTTPEFVQAWKKVRFLGPQDNGYLPPQALEILERPVRDWIKQQQKKLKIEIPKSKPIAIPQKCVVGFDLPDCKHAPENSPTDYELVEEKEEIPEMSRSFLGLWS